MEIELRTELHYHPSFRSPCSGFLFTEPHVPSLKRISEIARMKKIDLVAITSCSNAVSRDSRWYNYLKEAKADSSGNYKITSNDQAIIDLSNKPLVRYFFHGQEFKTDALDVNVLFADYQIPVVASKKIPAKADFNLLLDFARNSGENTVIAVRPRVSGLTGQDKGTNINENLLRELYESGKIDCLETFDGMDTNLKNQQCRELSEKLGIPGISVGDSHDLYGLGKTCTKIRINSENMQSFPLDSRYEPIVKEVKPKIKAGIPQEYKHEESISFFSKGLYLVRLAEAIVQSKLGLMK